MMTQRNTLLGLKWAPALLVAGLFLHRAVSAQEPSPPPAPSPQTVATGAALYQRIGCAACHGGVGQGGSAGPALAATRLPFAAFDHQVRDPVNAMPPYTRKVLSEADLRAIHAYLTTLVP